MRKKLKSQLCLLLALQMLCAPLTAQAQTTVPNKAPQTTAREETTNVVISPEGDVQTENLPDTGGADADKPNVGPPEASTPALPSTLPVAGKAVTPTLYDAVYYYAGYMPYARTDADIGETSRYYVERSDITSEGYIKVESWTEWGSDAADITLKTLGDKQYGTFPVCPSDRVPDRDFGGWYVYDGEYKEYRYEYRDASEFATRVESDAPLTNSIYVGVAQYFQNMRVLPLVGRWVLSNDATAVASSQVPAYEDIDTGFEQTAATWVTGFFPVKADGTASEISVTLYHETVEGKSPMELTAVEEEKKGFRPEIEDYYLRVSADVEAVDLSFITAEPFTDSEIADPEGHVAYTVSYGGSNVGAVPTLRYEALNSGYQHNGEWYPTNRPQAFGTEQYPARARWSVTHTGVGIEGAIPLAHSEGTGHIYNTVAVAVTPPDGGAAKTYRFHIQRLADPEMTLSPGNSPMGMIMRDSFSARATSARPAEAIRADAVDYFKTNLHFNRSTATVGGPVFICWPDDTASNNGAYLNEGAYSALAWPGLTTNPDTDPNTLVVYQNSKFTEPGLTLTNSEGKPVELTDGSVTRKVLLRQVETLGSDILNADAGDNVYYLDGELTTNVTNDGYEMVGEENGQTVFDLEAAKIKPGVYRMEYRFTDTVTGATYDAYSLGQFYESGKAEHFGRTLIVLSLPGDVDMDGVVTAADGVALELALEPWAGSTGSFLDKIATDTTAALFAYRVCDVNRDGTVNQEDADLLLGGFAPWLKRGGASSDHFYYALPGGHAYSREDAPVPPQTADIDKGGISLAYLGKATEEDGVRTATTTQALRGIETEVQVNPPKLTLGDVFWVAVRLDNVDKLVNTPLAQNLEGASFTIGYDASLVQPVTDLDDTDGTETTWQELMTEVNIGGAEIAGSDQTRWGGAYHVGAGQIAVQDTQPHSSKAVGLLESREGYRELTFTVCHDMGESRNLKGIATTEGSNTIYALRIPFRLIKHPYQQKSFSALDLSLGSRELMAAGATATGVWSQGYAPFGETKNLKDTLEYRGGSALTIPLGEDKTEYRELTNQTVGTDGQPVGKTVYGKAFYTGEAKGKLLPGEAAFLPKGLKYTESTGVLEGVPQQAGAHSFYISGQPYGLIVEKAPLVLTVDPQVRYYGEANPKFTYVYNTSQIMAADLSGGANHQPGFLNGGTSAELEKIAGWGETTREKNLPQVDAVDLQWNETLGVWEITPFNGGPESPAGAHYLRLLGGLNENYELYYTRPAGVGGALQTYDDWGFGSFSILPRPVYVANMAANLSVGTVLNDEQRYTLTGLNGVYDNTSGVGEKTFELTLDRNAQQPGITLSDFAVREGDVLRATYGATYQFDPVKDGTGPLFKLTERIETRNVIINGLKLTSSGADNQNGNYLLTPPHNSLMATGQVAFRPVTELELGVIPMDYNYGEKLRLGDLVVTIRYGDGPNDPVETVKFGDSEAFAKRGLHVLWSENVAGYTDDLAHAIKDGQELTVATHDGKYLCVYIKNPGLGSQPGNEVAAYSAAPFKIRKAKVDLTLTPKERYYGEENPQASFTFNRSQLSTADQAKCTTNQDSELVKLEEYSKPDMQMRVSLDTSAKAVDKKTPVGISYIIITGGSSANYEFRYRLMDSAGFSDTGGYHQLTIHPRPIVVEQVTMSTSGSPSEYFIYDDSNSTVVTEMYYADGLTKKPTATARISGADSFSPTLPVDGKYFAPGGIGGEQTLKWPLLTSGPAVLSGDEVKVSYRAAYEADSLTKHPYFTLQPGEASAIRTVKVRELTLLPDGAGKNYTLVYRENRSAVDRAPATYLDTSKATKGTVLLRPIESIAITKAPTRRAYTYGETLGFNGMRLEVTYESSGDNAPALNQRVRTVNYADHLDKPGNTFLDWGLKLYWTDAIGRQTEAKAGDYLSVAGNDGRWLTVSGQRHADAPHREVSASDATNKITVSKRSLTLTADKQYRYYGEPNATYTYTVKLDELAVQDRKKLQDAGLADAASLTGSAAGLGSTARAACHALEALGGYTGPYFETEATRGNGIGTYALTLSRDGAMDNYTIDYKDADIHIFRRPIQVEKITQNPVLTIFRDAPEQRFSAATSFGGNGFIAKLPVDNGAICTNKADPAFVAATNVGMADKLTMTGDAVYNRDNLKMDLTVQFLPVDQRPSVGSGGASHAPTDVTITKMVLTADALNRNYILVTSKNKRDTEIIDVPTSPAAVGQVDLRNIAKIEVVSEDGEQIGWSYTYGDTLDISKLWVKITYEKGADQTTPPPEIVKAEERGGVYVRYWPKGVPAPTSQEEIKKLATDYRPARTGDHVTIAPAHDAGAYKSEQVGENAYKFAHNDSSLIVVAIRHASYGYTPPVVVPANSEVPSVPGVLAVAPLDLTYKLEALGKVYDGDTKTVGSITLTNAYDHGDVTDVVYAVTGASYEKNLPYHDQTPPNLTTNYTEFLARPVESRYTFSSGTVSGGVPEYTHPEGYGNGLTFTLLDANVKYADDLHTADGMVPANEEYWATLDRTPRHDDYGDLAPMPVLVSNITLEGPDAANYTLDGGVDRLGNVGSNVKDTVPFATIDKAERDAPVEEPKIDVDRHTNTVRMTYPQDLTPVRDTGDDFDGEIHFEYALVYEKQTGAEDATSTTPTHWAGADGSADYQDGRFFGGEVVSADWPEGYEPEREEEHKELKEDDIIQGQIYRWGGEDNRFVPVVDENGVWEGYLLYRMAEDNGWTALPRGTYFWALTRVAETHNYKPSEPITSSSDGDREDDKRDAEQLAAAEAQQLTDKDYRPDKDDDTDPERSPLPMAKTYAQRMDVVYTEEKRGKDGESYVIPTLESVWFTDVQMYEKKEILDNVLRNQNPTRYYGYYWDVDKSASLDFKDPMDLSDAFMVDIKERQPDKSTLEKELLVNENSTAKIFISKDVGGETVARSIVIENGNLRVPLGSDPRQLAVVFTPKYVSNKKVTWTSSNPKVASVDNKGMLSFHGLGETTITAKTRNNKTAEILVEVYDKSHPQVNQGKSIFDQSYKGTLLEADKEGWFHPEKEMTRGELVMLLARFYKEASDRRPTMTVDFTDLTGEEPWAEDARLLASYGVITGVSGGRFAAEQTATRAEMATILARMLGIAGFSTKGQPHAFLDAGEKDTWAYSYIDALSLMGIIEGTGKGVFNPNGIVTRAQAAAFLTRLLDTPIDLSVPGLALPTDVPENNWAYTPAVRAMNDLTEKGK